MLSATVSAQVAVTKSLPGKAEKSEKKASPPIKADEPEKDANTKHLWRFDEGAIDEISKLEAVLTGEAKLAVPDRPCPDSSKAGKAVQVSGAGDGIEISFGRSLIKSSELNSFRAEAKIMYSAEIPKGTLNSDIFLLGSGWNNIFGIFKDKWKGYLIRGDQNDEIDRQELLKILVPSQKWTTIAIGFDKRSSKAYVEYDGKKIEFELQIGSSGNDSDLFLGGFTGWIDELKISMD